jgi:peptidoglycan-N-acetylglucosamine deacetylase
MPEPRDLYLTFDDGPDRRWTPRVLDILGAAGAVATFFVVGEQARTERALLRRMVVEGHDIGNHGATHRHPWLMSASSARAQVRDGTRAIADASGRAPMLFRPPYGRVRSCMVDEARLQGQALALWNRSAIDWGPLGASAAAIARRLCRARPQEVLLMHDGRPGPNHPDCTARALPVLLAWMQKRGMRAALLREAPAFSRR